MRPLSLYLGKLQGGKVKEFMTRTFTINGKLYQAREITFNTICELEDAGVSLTEIEQKPISTVRSYFAICLGGNKEYAGQEIERHIINGGNLDEIMTAFRNIQTGEGREKCINEKCVAGLSILISCFWTICVFSSAF